MRLPISGNELLLHKSSSHYAHLVNGIGLQEVMELWYHTVIDNYNIALSKSALPLANTTIAINKSTIIIQACDLMYPIQARYLL